MGLSRKTIFATPWHLIRFFIPITAVIPFVVYYLTVFTHVYPGFSAFLTAAAAGLCPKEDLSYPLFSLAGRLVSQLPYASLMVRLNLFCVVCGALAVACFYLLVARLVFVFACEDSGGSMAAMPPRPRDAADDAEEDSRTDKEDPGLAVNADGSLSIPMPVQVHNMKVAHAAVLGGLGAACVLAFSAPFWIVSTRFYPFTFDLLFFLVILNLLVSYDQCGRLYTLFLGVFLLAAFSVESPLFLLLLPVGGGVLFRSMILNDHATTGKVLSAMLFGLCGFFLALFFLWQVAGTCEAIPIPALRPILRVFQETIVSELVRWIPSFGWSYVFVQLLFPSALAVFVFSSSFRSRTPILLLFQLAMIVPLIPSLLNLSFSPWGIARATVKIPVYTYVIIALLTGLMIAVWYLMREMFAEKVEEDLDYYEYRDNPVVCRLGFILCWPLLLLACLVPFRSMTDLDPLEGRFADEVTEVLYRELGPRDWLVNSRLLQHHLMIRAYRDGRRLHFISTDPESGAQDALLLSDTIRTDPLFAPYRYRLLNAADLSTAAFLREWFRHETNAYQRIVLFDEPELWRANGFTAVPTGLFLSGLPHDTPVDTSAVLAHHQAIAEKLLPLISAETSDRLRYFAGLRKSLRHQLSRFSNELGFLLVAQNRKEDAAELFLQTEKIDPENLSLVLNRYDLAVNHTVRSETLPEIEARLRGMQQRVNAFTLSVVNLQAENGTLLNPDILEYVSKTLWRKSITFRNLAVKAKNLRFDPLTAIRDNKRELYQSISKYADANEFDDAERQLNLLLDLDDKDRFALINKARIAIERRDLPEAGLWLDLAKENGVPAFDLIWHEAAMLILNGKTVEARVMLNKVLPSNPGDIRLWGLLADILMRSNEFPELENRVFPAMRSASSKNEHYLMHMVRGYILKNNGPRDYPLARASFLRALFLNKHLTAVREEVLLLDDVLDVPAFCEEDAKAMLKLDPEHAFANYLWGSVRLRRGELELAEDLFARSLERSRNAPAYAGLGAVLLGRGDLTAAEKFLRRSLEMDNTRLFTWHMLARVLLATGRLDEASRALDLVLAGLPEELEVRLTHIRLLLKQGKLEEAALLVSDLLEDEDLLPQAILAQLKPIAAQLSKDLSE